MGSENNITNTIYCKRSKVSETNMLYEIWFSSIEDNKIRQNQYDSNEGHVITSILFKKFSNLVKCGTEIIQSCCLVLVFPDVPKLYWYLTECHAEKKKKKIWTIITLFLGSSWYKLTDVHSWYQLMNHHPGIRVILSCWAGGQGSFIFVIIMDEGKKRKKKCLQKVFRYA